MSGQHAMQDANPEDYDDSTPDDLPSMTLSEMLGALRRKVWLLTLGPLGAGLAALGVTLLIAPTFTASTSLMPPQQSQSGAASALASLGSLASLAGGAAAVGNSGDRYVALMQSVTLSDRIVDQFKLMVVYDVAFRVDARKELAANVRISLGKKDGLITVDVDDKSPQRAADIANRYVDELRRITSTLAVTEAQQRRIFFERQLQQSKDRLVLAQQALQASGFNAGSYLFIAGRWVGEYFNLAGGPTKGADDSNIFVVRANGSVVSNLARGSWLNRRGELNALKAEPGDTIYVPEEMNKTTWAQATKDWTQVFFQLGVGLAGIKTATEF